MAAPSVASVTFHGRDVLIRLTDGRSVRYYVGRDGRVRNPRIPGIAEIVAAGEDVVVHTTDGRVFRHRIGTPRPWDLGIGAGTGAPPGNYAPTNAAAPVISGSTQQGATLSSTTGSWSANPTPSYTYQWTRDGVNIAGATSATYVTQGADVGTTVRCVVTANNGVGSPGSASSNGLVITVAAPSNSVAPSVSGSTPTGSTLTAASGTWSGSPSFAYQWRRDGVDIAGAIASTYVSQVADIGAAISVRVTATNGGGSVSAVSSNSITVTAGGVAAAWFATAWRAGAWRSDAWRV